MLRVDDATARAYRAAWDGWMKQVERVHRVLLDDAAIAPAQLKGLLNREIRAWEAYEVARQRLLGLKESPSPQDADVNPFR